MLVTYAGAKLQEAHCEQLLTVKNSRNHHWTGTDFGAAPRRTVRSRKQPFADLRRRDELKNGKGSIGRDAPMPNMHGPDLKFILLY